MFGELLLPYLPEIKQGERQGFTAGVFLLCEEPSPLKDNPGSLFAGFFLSVCCG